jgi:tRNA (guanine26-N2/guanine27-N2)-dimethyltransferase
LTASRLGFKICPLFVHSYLHYIRVYVTVKLSSNQANKVHADLGYLRHCFKCGNREVIKEYNNKPEPCELCGNNFTIGGLLWISKFFDKRFIRKMANYNLDLKKAENKKSHVVHRILSSYLDEIDDIAYYFVVDEIASKLKTSPISVQKVIEKLLAVGYSASKVCQNTRGFKTNASINEILKVFR